MKKFRLKNLRALKIKIFNFNRLIVLLISGIIIFCIRYYINFFFYIINKYFNVNIYTDADINYLNSKYNSYNNKFSSEKIESYSSHIEDIHIPISSGKLNYAINLDQVDQFFKNLAIQEEDRHLNRL